VILVAGGTGFVGAAIVRELSRRGRHVGVLTRNADQKRDRFPGLSVEYRQANVREPESVAAALAGVNAVIGCQQFPNSPIENPTRGYTFAEVDAEGTKNLVAAAREAGVKRYVYLSGAGAATDAERHWFRVKAQAEQVVRESGIPYVIFRPSWVYGPEDRALNRFLSMARFLPFVPLIGAIGKQRMQPVFVDDVARAVAEALDNPAVNNQTLEIGGPEVLTMAEVVRTALAAAGKRRLLLPVPKSAMKLAAFVLQFAPGRTLTPDAVEFITGDALADPTKVEQALGVKMTPLREALATYLGRRGGPRA